MTTEASTSGSGVDLARVALQAARAAAKTAPAPKRRTGAARPKRPRGDGRDPLPFAAAIERMMAERGWDMAAKGGSIIDQWPTIAPELAGKVAAVKFDDETRTLHLRPVSPAYRLQLELHQRQIIDKVNATAGDGTVRTLKILAPGHVDSPPPTEATPQDRRKPAPTEPAEPRPKDPRYLAALAVHNEHKTTRETDLDRRIREAAEDQTRRLLARREPEDAFTEPAAQEEILRKQTERNRPKDPLQASVHAALAYKRTGRPQNAEPRRLSEAS